MSGQTCEAHPQEPRPLDGTQRLLDASPLVQHVYSRAATGDLPVEAPAGALQSALQAGLSLATGWAAAGLGEHEYEEPSSEDPDTEEGLVGVGVEQERGGSMLGSWGSWGQGVEEQGGWSQLWALAAGQQAVSPVVLVLMRADGSADACFA